MEEAGYCWRWTSAGDLVDVGCPSRCSEVHDDLGEDAGAPPDFLAVTRSGTWLIDRSAPSPRIEARTPSRSAAAAEAALACGLAVCGPRPGCAGARPASLDAMSFAAPTARGPLGLGGPVFLAAAREQGARFGEAAAASRCEPVARAQLLQSDLAPADRDRFCRAAGGPVAASSRNVRGEGVCGAGADARHGDRAGWRGWTVERRRASPGTGSPGQRRWCPPAGQLAVLACHPDCWSSSRTSAEGADRGRQPPDDRRPEAGATGTGRAENGAPAGSPRRDSAAETR